MLILRHLYHIIFHPMFNLSRHIQKPLYLTRRTMTHTSNKKSKQVYFIRHGQAQHNPRAEAAKESGCSHETFLELMRQDDVLDAPLTDLGKQQAIHTRQRYNTALAHVQLIVSSPLSRALQTADLVLCPENIPSLTRAKILF